MRFVRRFDEIGRGDVGIAGGKGANLGELFRAGMPVPQGFVLTVDAYREFVASTGIAERVLALAAVPPDAGPEAYEEPAAAIRGLFGSRDVPEQVAGELLAARAELREAPLAVRSSATAEDLEGASFAGQQETFLDVRGDKPLLSAVRDCWASLWTPRAMAYRARQGIAPADVALAVVVQEMVDADAAGVMFTANPTNGRRTETVISAAWGLGESVVSGSVTTDDLVVDKATGAVRSRTTADKAVMTVPTGSGTEERPVPPERRGRSVLDDAAAAALAGLGARIEAHFGAPQDIEWARADGAFQVLQSRPITALPEPEADPPTDWTVPDPNAYYMRASIVEQLPDPLSPLFADLADGSVRRSLLGIMRDLLGHDVLRDGEIGFPTVNGYAYYRYSRSGMARIMLHSPAALKFVFGYDASHGAGVKRWRDYSHPKYVRTVESWNGRRLDAMSVPELMDGVVELLDAGTEYYTSVQTIIPIAASSETLLTQFYDRAVRRAGDPPAATFLLGYDSAPIRAEKALHELGSWVRTHEDLAAALSEAPTSEIVTALDDGASLAGVDPTVWAEWCERFRGHLDRFGHTVYNLDFLNPVPADDPAPVLETLRFYLGGGGVDPHERQAAAATRRDAEVAAVLARLDPVRGAVFSRLVGWAQRAAPVREDALADIGLGWPQLRRMLREVGHRLVAAGVIDRPDDVFWLRSAEVLADPGARLADTVAERKAVWRGQRRVTPPQILPKGTVWDRFEAFMPASSGNETGAVLTGVGASAGQVTATARVLGGPEDFGRMRPGNVLVASITTPAWTPLFAMASAVVTDVGGPLSHSSIVAREYGIPAVLGTGTATRRIDDGAQVRVDGDAATVTLLDAAEDGAAVPAPRTETARARGRALVGAAVAAVVVLGIARRKRRKRRAS